MVVCVISASSSFSLLSHDSPVFVIYSIGLFASLSLSFFCVCLCSAVEGGTGLHGRDSLK